MVLLFPTCVAAIGGQRVAGIVEGSSRRLAETLSDPDRRALVAGMIDRRGTTPLAELSASL
jgi:hypothetical protein